MKAPFLLGRMIFGGFFLYNGINHIRNRKPMAQYTQSKGVPAVLSEVAVVGTGVAMLAGGASILSGVKPKWGALAILGFLGGVSPIMHDFWTREDPQQRQAEMINFTKNMAMAGAALALMGVEEPWEASVPIAQPEGIDRVRSLGRKLQAA
ncbi:MAG: DoxX family protein [Terriglobales bacterium]